LALILRAPGGRGNHQACIPASQVLVSASWRLAGNGIRAIANDIRSRGLTLRVDISKNIEICKS
jgi:hypothetical protein